MPVLGRHHRFLIIVELRAGVHFHAVHPIQLSTRVSCPEIGLPGLVNKLRMNLKNQGVAGKGHALIK